MQKLHVYQSMWAMERRRPDNLEWSLSEQLEMIGNAGFDGVGILFIEPEYVKFCTDILKTMGLSWQAQCYPSSVNGLIPVIDMVQKFGADHINLQPDIRPHSIEECIPLLEGWRRLGRNAGVPVHIETHRDRMTTDLFFMLKILDCFPDLQLTGDLSHYLVGREFAWPIDNENHRLMHRILDNCWGFHGRVASREQIQIQISFPHQHKYLHLFMEWWEYGFRSWRHRAPKDATLTFLCELGPTPYAITGSDGYELSDRWEEALIMMEMVRDLWKRLEDEDTS